MAQSSKSILIIGAAILDVLVRPADRNVFETGSSPAEMIKISTGGDALNEAAILAWLGEEAILDTVIGTDTAGDIIRRYCDINHISLDPRHIRDDIRTGVNVVLIQENGERSFITDPGGSLRLICPADVTLPFPDSIAIMSFASIFTYPAFTAEALEYLFRTAQESNITVCADMTSAKHNETLADLAPALSYVDYLMPNESEAFLVTGLNTAEDAAAAFFDAGVKNTIIKCGARGCYIRNKETAEMVPAAADTVCVDTTGAGDSFAAGFIHGISQGSSFRDCAVFANKCGASAVSCIGAADWIKASPRH